MQNRIRLIVGIIFWIGVLLWAGSKVAGRFTDRDDSSARELVQFAVKSRSVYELSLHDEYELQIGDPVFWRDEDGALIQVGVIRQVETPDSKNYRPVKTRWASVTFFSTAPPITRDSFLKLYETPSSMGWVAEALLPPKKRAEIARYIGKIFSENSDVIVEQLKPIFLEAVSETGLVVRAEMATAIAAHADQWQALGLRYQQEIVENQLVPLVNSEIWPIVQEELRPAIENIGEEIWRTASVWRFGWRAVYDSLPLPERDLTRQEFSRFVQNSALPILSAHMPELIAAQQRVLTRVVENPKVQQFAIDTFVKISNDAEMQNLILQIVQEAVLENQNFHRQLDEIWSRPRVQQALQFSDARFGPYVETIGEKLFGSPLKGVTPEFARILRHRIFLKDKRWLVLSNVKDDPSIRVTAMDLRRPGVLAVVREQATDDNPFFIEAKSRK